MPTSNSSSYVSPETLTSIERTLAQWKDRGSLNSSALPTVLEVYEMGKLLHALGSRKGADLRTAMHVAISTLPQNYRIRLFNDLKRGLLSVLENEGTEDPVQTRDASMEALESLSEIYQSSALAVDSTSWTAAEDLQLLISFYERHSEKNSKLQQAILPILSQWLWSKSNLSWEEVLPAIHLLQEREGDLWKDLSDFTHDRMPGWRSQLMERYPDHHDYLFTLVDVGEEDPAAALRQAFADNEDDEMNSQRQETSTVLTASQGLQRRIDQVRQVLPDLGEGFVEICLSYFKGDVEQTVSALMDDSTVPPQLRHLDRSLPRRQRSGPSSLQEDYLETNDRMIAKATVQAAQRQQEQEAYLVDRVMRQGAHDEYNDDYDDQYDDTEGFGAAVDTGLYDNYDAIKTYNRVLKQVEEDRTFWEDSRNTNRSQQPTNKKKKGGEKQYRGPDKLKGGRTPNFGRGSGRVFSNEKRTDDEESDKNRNSNDQTAGSRSGRGRGRGGRAPRAGRGGRGGRGGNATPTEGVDQTNPKGNQKAKARKLANRKERQKKAMAKRTG